MVPLPLVKGPPTVPSVPQGPAAPPPHPLGVQRVRLLHPNPLYASRAVKVRSLWKVPENVESALLATTVISMVNRWNVYPATGRLQEQKAVPNAERGTHALPHVK